MAATAHLTAAEVAERLRVSLSALYAMRHRGTAPRAIKRSKAHSAKLLFRLADVEAWEREHTA